MLMLPCILSRVLHIGGVYALLRRRWQIVSPENRRALKGIITVAVYVLLAKLLGAAKEMVVAYHYGVSPVLDGYLFVMNTIFWLTSWYYGTISLVVIPLLVRHSANGGSDRAEASRFQAELIGNSLLFSLFLSVVGLWLLSHAITRGWTGLSDDARTSALHSLYPLFTLLLLPVIASLFSTFTMARERHANSFLEAMPAIGVIFFCVVMPTHHVAPLVWGTVAGFFVQALILAVLISEGKGMPALKVGFGSPYWRQATQGVILLGAAHFVTTSATMWDTWLVSRLGEGCLSMLGYANRVYSMILSLAGTAVGRGILPVFSHVHSAKGEQPLQVMTQRWMIALFVISAVAVVMLLGVSPMMVQVLFQRGAFTPQDAQMVSSLLRIYLLQLPIYLVNLVVLNWLLGSGRPLTALLVAAVLGLGAKVVLSVATISSWGVYAIPISSVAMILVHLGWLYFYFVRRDAARG